VGELRAVWDGYDLNPLLLGEEAWRELGPVLDALAAGFKRELRVAPDALRRVAARLVELATGEPLAAYGPVFPPGSGASEPAVCAAMAAALGPALGYGGRQAEDAVVVCLLAALYGADAMRPADHDAAVRGIARLLGELRGGGEAPADTVRRYMAQTLCVRRVTRAVAVEGLEVSEAIAALMAGERRESVETLAAFVRTFGVCPRGAWVRLTDGTLGCVVGPARGGTLVVRSYAEGAGRVVRLTPAPVVAGAGRRIDIAGPVHEPCGHAGGAAAQGRGAGGAGDRQFQHG